MKPNPWALEPLNPETDVVLEHALGTEFPGLFSFSSCCPCEFMVRRVVITVVAAQPFNGNGFVAINFIVRHPRPPVTPVLNSRPEALTVLPPRS